MLIQQFRIVVVGLCLVLAGCATSRTPGPSPLDPANLGPKVPVILVPGVSGTELRDRETGEVLWGRVKNVLSPRDGGYTLARPLIDPIDGASEDMVVGQVLGDVALGPIRKRVYGPILELLEAQGFVRGDLTSPDARSDLFAFAYDWRGDNVFAARLLRERLEALAAVRGDGLEVDLICQSNGAYICRYLLKYGGVSLVDAEDGRISAVDFRIRKLILVGTSNGGSLRVLRELHRGRQYIPWFGRTLEPETLFSFPALFQDLLGHQDAPFVNARGESLDIDLFDAESWFDHGWSAFRSDASHRMSGRPDLFGDKPTRLAYLRAVLDRARRLHDLLSRDVSDFPQTRYYSLQNRHDPTPHLAVVGIGEDGLLFTGDAELEKRPRLKALATRPGDGHATAPSQDALSPQEKAALALPASSVRCDHFDLILQASALQHVLDFLRH